MRHALLALALLLAGCSASDDPPESEGPRHVPRPVTPRNEGPTARGEEYVISLRLGRTETDQLVAVLKANGDFSGWRQTDGTGAFDWRVRYSGRNIRLDVVEAAERAAIPCLVSVHGRRVEID